ncbi:MAG: MBL fold metallo-hydrolase [Saccharofermentanales bacterium]
MFKICSLYSGSSGNSIFISSGNDSAQSYAGLHFESSKSKTKILVDAGVSGKKLQLAMKSIGEDLDDIDGVLLTHEHIDHMAGIGVIVRRHKIPLYLTEKTWNELQRLHAGEIPGNLLRIFEAGSSFTIGGMEIRSFSIPHDAADPTGYRIASEDRSVSVFTDIGEIRQDIMDVIYGSDAVFIESNYDKDMLWTGSYPWYLKNRIDGVFGHLSNIDCAAATAALLEGGTEKFILSHLSQENNSPRMALRTTVEYLSGLGAERDKDYTIQVARRFDPGDPWVI